MRTMIMLRAMLALAATAMAGQIATGIHLQEVHFTGDTRLDGLDLKKCASDLKSQNYKGANWTDDLVGRVQTQCLVDKGYFKAAVQASSQQLADKNHTHQFAVTFHIDPGPRYHLGQITFKGNQAIADTKVLRDLFPTTDGSILDRKAIANGLENLRYAYEELGYINFTSVPTPRIDEDEKLVYFDIDVDEGKTFYISSIDVLGADPRV